MIIDCHGHYTTSSPKLQAFRDEQLRLFSEGKETSLAKMAVISDDEIIDSIENNQLKLIGNAAETLQFFLRRRQRWGSTRLICRHRSPGPMRVTISSIESVSCFPKLRTRLPASAGGGESLGPAIDELRRCVDMGFVGFNLNPDPSGGHWTGKPLTDLYWYPLYEVMVELDVPAMIHVSGSCNECHHTTGAHYINADTSAFMQLVQGDLFSDFPDLRFIIPHGGGAIPYHWGRYRASHKCSVSRSRQNTS